nr:asparagine synthase (glutamine-hydrolyzing) [Dongshaea marina]
MCGIFGYFSAPDSGLTHSQLLAMGQTLSHRGPDGMGIYHQPELGVGLGNQRLAILDVEHGQQPFISDDGSIVVVQNGEIFNYLELARELAAAGYSFRTQCDTEVILGLYQLEGISALNKLNGMFAIAIYDRREQALYLVRDRVGEKPLYYAWDRQLLLFGSEIKALCSVMPRPDLDYLALEEFLAFNYVPPPRTMFAGIRHLQPGCYLRVDANGIEEQRWWDLSQITIEKRSESEWVEKFNQTLEDAVRIRLRSDVPFGAFLSGGVDSSSVVGWMSQLMEQPVHTFSIGFAEPEFDESPFAAQAAQRFDTIHHSEEVDSDLLSLWSRAIYHCDQPHGDVSFMPTYRVAELASRRVKMVLTGDGADELFAGYDKYLNFFTAPERAAETQSRFQASYLDNLSLFDNPARSRLLSAELKARLPDEDCRQRVIEPWFDKAQEMDRINQALYLDTQLLLSGNNLVKPDRMGMAVSIENRSPFLDHRMVELAFAMPGELKLRGILPNISTKKRLLP